LAKAAVKQKDFPKLYFYAYDVTQQRTLINYNGTVQTPSASVLKVLTAATAIVHVPMDQRAITSVYSLPSEPGVLVLKGGGDFSLTKTVAPAYTTYTKAARLSTLATNSLRLLMPGLPITKIVLDASYFQQNDYNPNWKPSDRTNGYVSPITALQVDAGRANGDLTSKKYNGTRSAEPILDAGRAFRTALGAAAANATLELGTTPSDAQLLTQVKSMPMSMWLNHALMASDNTETEYIGRHAAIAAGEPSTFDGVTATVKSTLEELGISTKSLVMLDGSGLAQGDRVTAKLITQLMSRVADPTNVLAPMLVYLPQAGVSGTLGGRFTGRNSAAKGYIRAKSGYIPGLYSLAGIVTAQDGTLVSFAAFARDNGKVKVGYGARAALDTLAARIFTCGNGLTLG
jgi:D-alanyl-D-alanine carboxypeptidase/D-alanyl-D-alanine-endopeptidase (penicillin-binding protein 4)